MVKLSFWYYVLLFHDFTVHAGQMRQNDESLIHSTTFQTAEIIMLTVIRVLSNLYLYLIGSCNTVDDFLDSRIIQGNDIVFQADCRLNILMSNEYVIAVQVKSSCLIRTKPHKMDALRIAQSDTALFKHDFRAFFILDEDIESGTDGDY